MRPTAALLALAILCTLTPPAQAHRMRPSALTLRTLPAPAGHVEVVWQVALANGRPTPLDLDLPEHCRDTDGPRRTTTDPSAITTRFEIDCGPQGLTRGVLKIEGLSDTGTEVLATIDGATHLLSRDRPHLQLGAPSAARGLGAYVGLGVEHILLGLDHLCFVLDYIVTWYVNTQQVLHPYDILSGLKHLLLCYMVRYSSLAMATREQVRIDHAPLLTFFQAVM